MYSFTGSILKMKSEVHDLFLSVWPVSDLLIGSCRKSSILRDPEDSREIL